MLPIVLCARLTPPPYIVGPPHAGCVIPVDELSYLYGSASSSARHFSFRAHFLLSRVICAHFLLSRVICAHFLLLRVICAHFLLLRAFPCVSPSCSFAFLLRARSSRALVLSQQIGNVCVESGLRLAVIIFLGLRENVRPLT